MNKVEYLLIMSVVIVLIIITATGVIWTWTCAFGLCLGM